LLLTAVLLRRRSCCAPAVQQSTDISCPLRPQAKAANPPHAAADTGGRTDTVPLDRPWRILCEQCQEQYSAIMRLWSPAAKAFLMHRLYWFTVDNGAGQPATLFVFGP